MGKVQKYFYYARLMNCGTSHDRFGYSTLKDASAVCLAVRILEQFSSAVVKKAKKGMFMYDLACLILRHLNIDLKKLPEDIQTAERRTHYWCHSRKRNEIVLHADTNLVWLEPEKPSTRIMPNVKNTR
jgi:hypothetical protein